MNDRTEHIRTRAFFLWENQTGRNWRDSGSNWLEAEAALNQEADRGQDEALHAIELYNFYMGDERPGERFATVRVGPFQVSLTPDYDERVARMGRHATKTISYALDGEDGEDGEYKMQVTHTARRIGGWEVTAIATCSDMDAQSLLAGEPISDGGVWDLCALLTFITGRRVSIDGQLERFNPNKYGVHACTPTESLWAAAVAWENRNAIVSKDLIYALLMHNEALSQAMLQISAALNNTALNILIDRMAGDTIPVAKEAKLALKSGVVAAVDACEMLTNEQKRGFRALLGSKVDQGLGSMADRTQSLLIKLGIVGDRRSEEVDRRIKFLNKARNDLTHKGEPPHFKDLTPEQSMRYTLAIVTGVIPVITNCALGQVLGFMPKGVGSLSQNPRDAIAFFLEGSWQGWRLELLDFESWFYGDGGELSSDTE